MNSEEEPLDRSVFNHVWTDKKGAIVLPFN